MKNLPIRLLVVIGALTMAAIVATQVYWVTQAIDRQEEEFKLSVQMALRNVVESLCQINGNDIPSNNPIDQLSNNYFIARTNYKIDISSLDYLLKAELQKRNIEQDYEFGVYDCQTDRMVYGDFVSLKDQKGQTKPKGKLPKLVNDEYYFGVYFPGMTGGVAGGLGVWKVATALTVVILIFFSYALVVILRQKRLSEVQRDFINNMTHEFKTPLATLKVSSEVLLNESASERQKRYAGIVMAETDRLQKQVQQLLETSLLDHKTRYKTEIIEPEEVIHKLVERFRVSSGSQIVEEYQVSGATLKGDPMLFENIIFNLLDNAVKYGRSARSIKAVRENNKITISVTNDGPAIPPREQKKIFHRFYRIQKGDLHDVKGFGLGLYFVKNAMRTFHGTIGLQSGENRTTFTLTFPVA